MRSLILLGLFLVGCTDADVRQMTTLGNSGVITCYSGGKEIYRGKSTGKIATEDGSDGWYFVEAVSYDAAGSQMNADAGKLVRVSGDCLIKN